MCGVEADRYRIKTELKIYSGAKRHRNARSWQEDGLSEQNGK